MKTIKLNDGHHIPSFGLGTFLIGTDETTTAYETVMMALKMGYRHIDTAQMYYNESEIGRAINDSGIPRSEIFVTTKIQKHHDGNIEKLKESLDLSLSKLNIGYIDLMLIHWPNPENEVNATIWQLLEDYKRKGLFKSIGVSNFLIHHLESLYKTAKIMPAVNQVEFHPLLTQVALKKYLKAHDIQMISYGPFARGKVFEGKVFEALEKIGQTYDATVAQVIIAWGLNQGIVMIPKSVHEKRLLDNFNARNLKLSNEDIEKINGLNQGKKYYSDPDNNINYF